jgi:hypothetical protein
MCEHILNPPVYNMKACWHKSIGILTVELGLVFQVRKEVDFAVRTVVLVGVLLPHSAAATQAGIRAENTGGVDTMLHTPHSFIFSHA